MTIQIITECDENYTSNQVGVVATESSWPRMFFISWVDRQDYSEEVVLSKDKEVQESIPCKALVTGLQDKQ